MKTANLCKIPEHGLQIEETAQAGDREGVEHLSRYWWAWTQLKSRFGKCDHLVWDIGCGSGYGAAILSEQLPNRVVGLDTDKQALLTAWRDYPSERVQYHELFLEQAWTHDTLQERPHAVTIFDTLEQLKHRDYFLEQLVSRLRPESIVMLSVQDLRREQCQISDKTAYFRYNRPVLESLLRRYFGIVQFGADPNPAGGTFAYYRAINPQIAGLIHRHNRGELYSVGHDVVFCADPKH